MPKQISINRFLFYVGRVSYVTNIKNENAKPSKYGLLTGILISEGNKIIIQKDVYESAVHSTYINSQLNRVNC